MSTISNHEESEHFNLAIYDARLRMLLYIDANHLLHTEHANPLTYHSSTFLHRMILDSRSQLSRLTLIKND